MKDHKELSLKVANAVLKQIEDDRSINRNSIQDAVQKELAVYEPEQPDLPKGSGDHYAEIVSSAQTLVGELLKVGNIPYAVAREIGILRTALHRSGF